MLLIVCQLEVKCVSLGLCSRFVVTVNKQTMIAQTNNRTMHFIVLEAINNLYLVFVKVTLDEDKSVLIFE